MRKLLDEFVPGAPKTKGSVNAVKRSDGGTYVRQNVQGSVRWARLVEQHVRQVWGDRDARVDVPIRVTLTYYLPVTPERLLRQGSGDVDKLERNVLDALTKAGVYGDDAQVVGVVHEKRCADARVVVWADGPAHPQGVRITVWEDVAQ